MGAGIEILDEDQVDAIADLPDTGSVTPKAVLSQNLTAYGNLSYVPIPKVTLGLEVGYITTTYKYDPAGAAALTEGDGKNLNVNTAFKLDF